ncbi:hypothetical protein [Mesorhizobium sp. M0047]|uniref:hypothetical protein n=1 Tax=Mesorhizobium sp. M0047 TaxID=2956859 RepID=UPI0033368193
MSLVVIQDRRRKFFHAVLSVSTGSGTFILDSLSNAVLRDSDFPIICRCIPLAPFGPGSMAQNRVERRRPTSTPALRRSRPAKADSNLALARCR